MKVLVILLTGLLVEVVEVVGVLGENLCVFLII